MRSQQYALDLTFPVNSGARGSVACVGWPGGPAMESRRKTRPLERRSRPWEAGAWASEVTWGGDGTSKEERSPAEPSRPEEQPGVQRTDQTWSVLSPHITDNQVHL